MASKPLYLLVAVAGIAAASGAAWWWQQQPSHERPAPVAASPVRSPEAGEGAPAAARRPPAVEAARVEVTRLVDEAQAVGTLRSRQSVMLRPEVSGRVAQINFRDGQRVQRGQLMVQLDDQLPRAQLAQAEAELSIARANHRRNQELVAQNFISQRAVDESAAALQVAQAKLALARATADRLRVLAPFDGVAGLRNVNVGDYLKDGADIVNIEDIAAILVDFRLPERFQARLRPGQDARVALDALPGRVFEARIQAIDPLVDANGRSVGVRACIDNRQQLLRPGMFARVNAVFAERPNALMVPEEAVVPQGGRPYVLRLQDGPDPQLKVAQRVEVRLGARQPGKVEILEGLAAGDQVVVAGQQRVQRDGMAVRVVDLSRGGAGGAPADGARTPGARRGAADAQSEPARAPSAAVMGAGAARPVAGNPCGVPAAAAGQPRR